MNPEAGMEEIRRSYLRKSESKWPIFGIVEIPGWAYSCNHNPTPCLSSGRLDPIPLNGSQELGNQIHQILGTNLAAPQ